MKGLSGVSKKSQIFWSGVIVIAFFLILSCAKKEERTRSGEYIAKVGNAVITRDDIEAIPESVRHIYMAPQGLERFIDEQILYQEALKKGLDRDEGYLRMVEYLKRKALIERLLDKEIAQKIKITDREVVDYYNKNKEEFKIKETGKFIELDSIKEGLRGQLLMERQRELFDKYLTKLKKAYKVEINEAAIGQLFQNR